MYDTNPHV